MCLHYIYCVYNRCHQQQRERTDMTNFENAFDKGWLHATIRKGYCDYINFKTGKVATGKFWDIKFDNGFDVQLPASLGKGRAIEYVHNAVAYCEFTTIK